MNSLRARLAGTLGLVFLAGMLALYLAARSYSSFAADRSYDRLLNGAALSIGETLSAAEGRISVDIPYSALDMLSAAPDDKVFYRVIDPDDETVTGYPDLPRPPGIDRIESVDPEPKFFEARYRGELVHFAYLPRYVVWRGRIRSAGVQVGQTGQARTLFAQELLIGAFLPIAIMTVIALLVVWFGIGIALRPLTKLSEELLLRQPQDLGPLLRPVPKEIRPLVRSLNGFMQRLDENLLVLRSFIADAAHQIRTPLTTLSAQAQLAVSEEGEELAASLATINRSASKLTRLVNQLLSDATVQHRADVRGFEKFDLYKTIHKAIRESVPLSEDSDVRFITSLDRAICVGDPVMIGEVMKNLIHNALIHGRSDEGVVTIELREEADSYKIVVSDRGQGIPVADHDKVFERFTRRDGRAPGAGLGLAIVRQSINAHRGSIALRNRSGGGLSITTILPKGMV